jgi:phenylalanyl-tRNA synthetase beta chain
MKVSLSWLKDFLPPQAERLDAAEAARALTMAGLEVEGIEEKGRELMGVLIAEVVAVRPHPGAEKLRLVRVRAGAREEEVVCGAPNVPPPGNRVCWAVPSARLPGGRVIEAREVRGVLSPGMLCSEPELGLGDRGDGILVLSPTEPPGEDLARHFGIADDVLEVNVTPNRPDALSHLGIARELVAGMRTQVRLPDPPPASSVPTGPSCDVRILEGAGCPRYQARFVTGVTVAASPLWMRLRLSYCGVRPISNLVDVTNYVLLGLGHPLHAFDFEKVQGPITVRRAREGEPMVTLDGQERRLHARDIVIADERGPVAIAGVMGGATSEVTEATRHVLLEAATFEPVSIRRTSRRLGLASEASYRFERGVDAEGVPAAAELAVAYLAALGGGAVVAKTVDRYPQPPARRQVRLGLARFGRVSGLRLSAEQVRAELDKVAEEVSIERSEVDAMLVATIPSYRPDLVGPEDLIEEVLRLGGYYASSARPERVLPNARSLPNPEAASDRARDVFVAFGLHEIESWAFVPRASLKAIAGGEHALADAMVVANPISADYEVMRTSLLPGLADALRRNLARGLEDVLLFEVGPVVRGPQAPGEEPAESEHAALLMAGRAAGWLKPGEPLDFFDLKRVVEDLLAAFGAQGAYEAHWDVPFLHPGVAARVTLADGRPLGVLGELHPVVARKLGIERRALFCEVDLDVLAGARAGPRTVAPPPRYPAVARDISFWIDARTPAAEQRAAFLSAGETLLRELQILEDFRDPKYVPAGKKGMLWTLTYRADDRTLTDAEADAAHGRVVQALKGRLAIEIR